ncbi:hypothetical protein PAXINDRAFT_11524 [Paxillus involutus ATCC 200175]|uniref:Uncharacterized protein n=1 Tax=Paxillus involutus ATCC 200175 TaxID=664439 RepID=A0A0C9UAI1_PAXIN|nr:hypothetical protein PAXINDRAFT_11524 [Paxillus involutus ATCC 200175]
MYPLLKVLITPERAAEEEASWVSLHLCSTHVMIVQRRHHEPTRGWECHIEAYPHPTLPSSNDPEPSTLDNNNNIPEIHLQLSHRGVCPASMLFSGPVVWERKMPRTTDGQTHSKSQSIRVVLIAHRAPPLPCLAAAELVLLSSPISSSHSSANTNPRLEPATITCTLHDVLLPPDSDSRRGFFYTASRGNDSRGVIESSASRSRRDQEKHNTFGFTLSLEVQPDLTPKPEQVGAGDLGNDQNTGAEKMKVSLWAEKLTLPVATGPCFVVGFDGNVGRMFRRHPSQGKEIMEIIDFA